jgi:hypothetical protein
MNFLTQILSYFNVFAWVNERVECHHCAMATLDDDGKMIDTPYATNCSRCDV